MNKKWKTLTVAALIVVGAITLGKMGLSGPDGLNNPVPEEESPAPAPAPEALEPASAPPRTLAEIAAAETAYINAQGRERQLKMAEYSVKFRLKNMFQVAEQQTGIHDGIRLMQIYPELGKASSTLAKLEVSLDEAKVQTKDMDPALTSEEAQILAKAKARASEIAIADSRVVTAKIALKYAQGRLGAALADINNATRSLDATQSLDGFIPITADSPDESRAIIESKTRTLPALKADVKDLNQKLAEAQAQLQALSSAAKVPDKMAVPKSTIDPNVSSGTNTGKSEMMEKVTALHDAKSYAMWDEDDMAKVIEILAHPKTDADRQALAKAEAEVFDSSEECSTGSCFIIKREYAAAKRLREGKAKNAQEALAMP